MTKISIDIKNALGTVSEQQIQDLMPQGVDGLNKVEQGTGAGNDFLGWVDLPTRTPESLSLIHIFSALGFLGAFLGMGIVL